MQRQFLFNLAMGLLLSGVASAVEPARKVPPGSRIFIDNMSPTMAGYLAGEFTKKKLPLTITKNREKADFVLDGQMEMHDRNWRRVLFGGKADSGSALLYDAKTEDVVWSGNAGGRSFWVGDNKSERRVAGRLAKQMKKELFRR